MTASSHINSISLGPHHLMENKAISIIIIILQIHKCLVGGHAPMPCHMIRICQTELWEVWGTKFVELTQVLAFLLYNSMYRPAAIARATISVPCCVCNQVYATHFKCRLSTC